MAVCLIAGGVVGVLCQQLASAVQDVATKTVIFKSVLKSLEEVLNRITPIFEDIEKLNKVLERPKSETKMFENQLEQGLKLVQKCTKIKWWNYVLRPLYVNKIQELEESLLKFFQIDVQLQIARDSRQMLVSIERVETSLHRLETNGSEGFAGCCGVPGAPEFVVGLDEALRDLKRKVIEGTEKVVVVSAPGGCGKTTLAKMICHDEDTVAKYKENIFFVTFSKTPNLKVIISNMFNHKGLCVPEFQTEEEAFNKLEQMLRQIGSDHILTVLDDVWPGSESYIERFQFRIPYYKVLITSRSVFPRFYSYKLKLLDDKDAMKLFLNSAFPQGGSSQISVDIVNMIVKGCGGFPLALKVVGGSLRGQVEVIWRKRLKQWSQGQSIFYSDSDLLICLQSSIDALDNNRDNVKECFLDLASFPEDQRVPVATLVDIWAELYDLDDDDALANLYELSDRNLVNLVVSRKDGSENDGYYNEHFVTQHDILRELAIHHSRQNSINERKRLIVDRRGNDLPKWWIERKQHPICAQLMSISADGPILNWDHMELPNVKVLVVNIQSENDKLPQLMEKSGHLKTLIITNNDFRPAQISNFSLLGHLQNLKRIRLEHITITSFADSILQLKNLRKLSLIMCKVDDACKECTVQAPDMPNLVEAVFDYCSDLEELPMWLCNISSLEKISITNCHDLIGLSEEFGKLKNLESLHLNSCTKLSELPESIGALEKLHFLDLSDCVSLTNLPERIGELCNLRKLNTRGCGLMELPESVKELEQLKYLICDDDTLDLWEEFQIYLPDLKLHVTKEIPNLDWLQ